MNRIERREQNREPSPDDRVQKVITRYHGGQAELKPTEEKPRKEEKTHREKMVDRALGEAPKKKQEPAKAKPVKAPAEPEETAESGIVPGLAPSPEQASTKAQAEALEATDLDPQDSAERREITDPAGAAETEQDAGQHILSRDSKRAA